MRGRSMASGQTSAGPQTSLGPALLPILAVPKVSDLGRLLRPFLCLIVAAWLFMTNHIDSVDLFYPTLIGKPINDFMFS